MKFEKQAEQYMTWIQTRKRQPIRPASARIYQSYLDSHILPRLGDLSTYEIDNREAKKFVAELNSLGLAPTTINQIFNVMTAVIASAVDENGEELYPRKWNHDFIDLPVVEKAGLKRPIVAPEQVLAALQSPDRRQQAMLVLLAASGLRIGELMALQGHLAKTWRSRDEEVPLKGTYGFSYWDPDQAIVYVKNTISGGKFGSDTKTEAGRREVDLHPDINQFLIDSELPETGFLFQNALGNGARYNTLMGNLKDLGIKSGFHAFRRFRITHLETQNVPAALQRFWTGHADRDVHESYMIVNQDLKLRQEWALKAGYGFELPK